MHNQNPTVSIIMPAFNAGRTIKEAIISIQKQTFESWELIVIDDHSQDNTKQIVSKMMVNDYRIKLISTSHNTGSPAKPRNLGIEQASGDYIAFLDSDDLWLNTKLEKQFTYMKNNNIALSCTGYYVIDHNNNGIGQFIPKGKLIYSDLLLENSIGCLTAMYDTKILGKRYFPICGHEDYALWLSILKDGYTAYGLPELLASYRLQQKSVSSNKIKVLKFFWHIYRVQEKFSLVKSIFYCGQYAWNTKNKYRKST